MKSSSVRRFLKRISLEKVSFTFGLSLGRFLVYLSILFQPETLMKLKIERLS
jgi:hypothetical protein